MWTVHTIQTVRTVRWSTCSPCSLFALFIIFGKTVFGVRTVRTRLFVVRWTLHFDTSWFHDIIFSITSECRWATHPAWFHTRGSGVHGGLSSQLMGHGVSLKVIWTFISVDELESALLYQIVNHHELPNRKYETMPDESLNHWVSTTNTTPTVRLH